VPSLLLFEQGYQQLGPGGKRGNDKVETRQGGYQKKVDE
jgi:hypothetical protein